MERMMEDMRRVGMLAECEERKGFFEVVWPRGVEMKVVEVEEGKVETESEK